MAGSTADGSVVIDVNMDVSEAEKRLAKLRGDIKKTEKEISDMTKARDEAKEKSVFQTAELDAEKVKLQEIKDRLADIRALSKDKSINVEQRGVYAAQIPAVKQELSDQQYRVRALQTEWNKTENAIDGYNRKIDASNQKLSEMQGEAGILTQEIDRSSKAQGLFEKASEASKEAMGRLNKRVLGLMAGAFVFNIISRALTAVQQLTMKYIKTNDEARQAIAQLKGALLTLAQPLIEVIIPAFTLLVSILAKIITAVAQFVSMLFGKTLKQSKDGAKALHKEASAIGAVGEAADEAAGSLAGFDEINTINTENAKGAGGGGTGTGGEIAPDFDFEESNLKWLIDTLGESANWVAAALILGGIALIAIGACTGNLLAVLSGLLLLGAGISIGEETGALQSWVDTLGLKNVAEFVVLAVLLAGITIVALAAAMGNIFMVLAGLALIGTTIAYINASGMMKSWTEEQISKAASYVTAALLLGGIFLVVAGAATANILMVLAGLGLLAAGIYVGVESKTLEAWATVLGLDSVFDYVVVGIQLAGIALIAIGAAMSNILMVVVGGIILGAGIAAEIVGEETLKEWWETLKLTSVQQWVSVALLLGGIAFIAIGVAMSNILMVIAGLGMIGLGTVVAANNGNLKDWVTVLGLQKVVGWVTVALLLGGIGLVVFGVVTGNILMVLAGLGLLGAGIAIGVTSGTFRNWVDTIIDGLKGLKRDVSSWWTENAAKFFTLDYWKDLGKGMIDGLLEGLAGIFTGLASWASNVWNTITGAFSSSNARASVSNSAVSNKSDKINPRMVARSFPEVLPQSIPALARGAVIPPNREFMAVLGDQHHGNNLEAPEDLIRKIVREEAGGNDNTALLQAILTAIKDGHIIMVDGAVFGRTAIKTINSVNTSAGKQLLLI